MELTLKSFKALSSATRVVMLRELRRRRMTTTELSKLLGIHVTTANEHLLVLQQAGLVIKEDEGHKWKYYALTQDGKEVVSPYSAEIKIMLFVSVLLIGVGLLGISTFQMASVSSSSSFATQAGIDSMLAREAAMGPMEKAIEAPAEAPIVAAGGVAEKEAITGLGANETATEPEPPPAEMEYIIVDESPTGGIEVEYLLLLVAGAAGIGAVLGLRRARLSLSVRK